MSEKEYIRIDDLKSISNCMKEKKDRIIQIYNEEILSLLVDSKDCIEYSNQRYDEINKSFQDCFSKFDYTFDEIISILDNKIIPSYKDLSDNLKDLFHKQFAKKFEELINLNHGEE